jgi:hypothetical protein
MNKWQSDVLQAIDHLRRFADWTLPAEVKRHDRSAVCIGNPGNMVRVFRGGCTWSEPALAIDASMVRNPAVKSAALLLARTLAVGWRCVMVAVGGSTAVYAGGKLVGRMPQ